METTYIEHHGILGQKWGVRRYQNPDGTLTPAGRRHLKSLEKKDVKWANKNYNKITKNAYKQIKKDLDAFDKMAAYQGATGKRLVNLHNQKMAELMNTKVSDITAPSGRAVRFIAKRGEVGVHMALADAGYDMSSLKNGVWGNGRIAYKKKTVDMK